MAVSERPIKVDIHQLIFSYIIYKSEVKEDDLVNDITNIINQLNRKNILVDSNSNEEIDVLINYWKQKNLIKDDGNRIRISESNKDYLDVDFIKNRMFDPSTNVAHEIMKIYEVSAKK